eukprot:COSAG04_NODE_13331_length_610_cov_1.892368_1_plen_98_part_00
MTAVGIVSSLLAGRAIDALQRKSYVYAFSLGAVSLNCGMLALGGSLPAWATRAAYGIGFGISNGSNSVSYNVLLVRAKLSLFVFVHSSLTKTIFASG